MIVKETYALCENKVVKWCENVYTLKGTGPL